MDADAVVALDRQILQRLIVEQDADFYMQNTHEDYLVVAPGGKVEDREEAVRGLPSLDVKGIELSDQRVSLSGNTAVVVGKLLMDGTMKPVGRFGPLKYMAVYVHEDGRWRLLGRALTPCLPIAIERGVC